MTDHTFEIPTKGHYDFIDITAQVRDVVARSDVKSGIALVFVEGSTAAIMTMEFESGIVADLIDVFEKWAPEDADYAHHRRWGDRNGAAHIKSAIVGTDLAVPVDDGSLRLGTWQQIVLVDFDERPRTRVITVKVAPTA